MPNVAQELAELRKHGLTKKASMHLKNASGRLSTPEIEQETLKAKAEKDRKHNYKKDAEKALKVGTKELDLHHDFKRKQIVKKKEEKAKQKEAVAHRQSFQATTVTAPEVNLSVRDSISSLNSVVKDRGECNNGGKVVERAFIGSEKSETEAQVEAPEEQITEESATKNSSESVVAAVSSTQDKEEAAKKNVTYTHLINHKEEKVDTEQTATESFDKKAKSSILSAEKKVESVDKVQTIDATTEKKNEIAVVEDVDTETDTDNAISHGITTNLTGDASNIQSTQSSIKTMQSTPSYQNRAEKKSRKMMQRLKMKHLSGILRVTMKLAGANNGHYNIERPDVYEKNGSYVIFGVARQGAGLQREAAMQQSLAAQQFPSPATVVEKDSNEVPVLSTFQEGIDDIGINPEDLEVLMNQASCTRVEAVKALKENEYDLVNAIMSLTT